MKDVLPILYSLGFLDSEVKTYMAALVHGPSTVLELCRHTHLSRQATYVVIESLTKRGLMSSVMRGKKKYYVSEDPDKLLSYARRKEMEIKEKISDLERSLPELKLKIGGERPVVKLFEGKEGARTVMADIAETQSKDVYEISDLESMQATLSREDVAPTLASLKKAGVHFTGIYAGTPSGKTLSSTRYFLPKELLGFHGGISVYGNKIAMFTYEGKIFSVVIENPALSRTFKILFELAFKGAKELPSD